MGKAMGVEQLPTPTVADVGVLVVMKLGYCGYALILLCFLYPWWHVLLVFVAVHLLLIMWAT